MPTKHDILMEDMQHMQDGMARLESTKEDIWQDEMIWWLLKSVNDLIDTIDRQKKAEQIKIL